MQQKPCIKMNQFQDCWKLRQDFLSIVLHTWLCREEQTQWVTYEVFYAGQKGTLLTVNPNMVLISSSKASKS